MTANVSLPDSPLPSSNDNNSYPISASTQALQSISKLVNERVRSFSECFSFIQKTKTINQMPRKEFLSQNAALFCEVTEHYQQKTLLIEAINQNENDLASDLIEARIGIDSRTLRIAQNKNTTIFNKLLNSCRSPTEKNENIFQSISDTKPSNITQVVDIYKNSSLTPDNHKRTRAISKKPLQQKRQKTSQSTQIGEKLLDPEVEADSLIKQAQLINFETTTNWKQTTQDVLKWGQASAQFFVRKSYLTVSTEKRVDILYYLGCKETVLAKYIQTTEDRSLSYYKRAFAYHSLALKILEQALQKAPDSKELQLKIAMNLNEIGNYYYFQGNFDEAFQHHKRALESRMKMVESDPLDVATSINNIAVCYFSRYKFSKAAKCFHEALFIWNNALEKEHLIAMCSYNLGMCYHALEKHEEALVFLKKAEKFCVTNPEENHPFVKMVSDTLKQPPNAAQT